VYNIFQYNIFYYGTGYYRVNYNLENWHQIIYYLNSESGAYKYIDVINRAKMIDDAFHLMMARQLDVSIFLELTKYLSQETDFVAWYPMIKVFEHMSTILPFPSTHYFGYAYIKVMINRYYIKEH